MIGTVDGTGRRRERGEAFPLHRVDQEAAPEWIGKFLMAYPILLAVGTLAWALVA